LDAVFEDTLSYHVTIPSFGIWGFNMARMNAEIPTNFKFGIETQFMNEPTMQAAMIFGKDTQKVEVPVNTIMEPKLYQLYLDDLKK
jgi:spermidine synthase